MRSPLALAQVFYKGCYCRMLDILAAFLQGEPGRLGEGACLFLGRRTSNIAGGEGIFNPSGVLVGHKSLLTAESPADVLKSCVCMSIHSLVVTVDFRRSD